MADKKYVYPFEEAYGLGKELLGGKGAGLAEMTHIGVPVPEGFTITTEACTLYYDSGKKIPDGLLQAGDIIRYKKTNGHQHTLMYYGNGKIAEAGRENQFPAIEKDTKKYNASNVKLSTRQVIRAK